MIAIDIMGGDFAPEATIVGALEAAKKNIPVALFGPKDLIADRLADVYAAWKSLPIVIHHAPEIIEMGEEPVQALRKKTRSSLAMAIASVVQGDCIAVVSAGNSGALVAGATLLLGRREGIARPAIAGFIPDTQDVTLCLDLGANTECKPHYFTDFARLAVEYLSEVKGVESPSIALLSNGEEEGKGSMLVKQAYELLAESSYNFIGNIEPSGVLQHRADVVLCDGFAGNVLLKTIEGMSDFMISLCSSRGVNAETLASLKEKVDWSRQGGALLLGVRGVVVVAHGCSKQDAVENAIKQAWSVHDGTASCDSRHDLNALAY